MKRLASVIISIVFIFTACDRHALEREVFSTAETGNEVFETEEREQAENEKSSRTTGYYAGAAACVIAAVGITAAVIIYNYNIEKTYEIFARIKPNTRLTVQQIVDKLIENRMIFDRGMIFNLKINSDISTELGYLLRVVGPKNDIIAIFDRNKSGPARGLAVIPLGSIARIKNGEIEPNVYPQKLMEIKTRHIETLEIISNNPENTRFLKKLIEITTDPPVEIPEEISEEEEEQERRPEEEVQERRPEEEQERRPEEEQERRPEEEQERRPEEEQERRPEEEEQPIITDSDSDSDYTSSSV